jgi:hypothetical protein
MVAMVVDEQPVLPFDVDNNSLPERHLMIVGRRRLRQRCSYVKSGSFLRVV